MTLKHEVSKTTAWEADIDKMDLETLYPDNPKVAKTKKDDLKEYFRWTGQSSSA